MIKTKALVIKKQNYRETDRILTIFSPDFGKKTIIARGIRKPLSKMSGHLDTLMLAQIILTHDQELPTVTSCQLIGPFDNIRKSYKKTNQASAVIKLIDKVVLENINQDQFFNLTINTLINIDEDRSWEHNWLYFLHNVLVLLGLEPGNFVCHDCKKKETSGYKNIGDRNFVCCDCVKENSDLVKLDERTVKLLYILGEFDFDKLERVPLPEETSKKAEEVLLKDISEWFGVSWLKYSTF